MLASAPTTTEMTLMLLIFHIFFISLFSSWYLSIFSISFSLTLTSPGIAISIMAQLLSLYSLQQYLVLLPRYLCLLYHNIPQNLHFLISNNNFWSMFIPFFNSFQVVFPTQFSINYSCNIAVPSLVLILFQLFAFAHNMRHCFPFLVTHSTKW